MSALRGQRERRPEPHQPPCEVHLLPSHRNGSLGQPDEGRAGREPAPPGSSSLGGRVVQQQQLMLRGRVVSGAVPSDLQVNTLILAVLIPWEVGQVQSSPPTLQARKPSRGGARCQLGRGEAGPQTQAVQLLPLGYRKGWMLGCQGCRQETPRKRRACQKSHH